MLKHRKIIRVILSLLILTAAIVGVVICLIHTVDFGFARAVSEDERQLRLQVVSTAESWLGTDEGSPAHAQILEIYNTHEPLAQGYEVQPDDNWCAAFVSTIAIQCALTDIIPTECGCQRQIGLFAELDCWVEDDDYVPLPGDIIYYCSTDADFLSDCTGWSDHVGIVAGTWHGVLKVIEGNNGDAVNYRYIPIGSSGIRGYATPDYDSKTAH